VVRRVEHGAAAGDPPRAGGEKSIAELAVTSDADDTSVRPAVRTLERAGLIYT
jgi:predicted transcriptional regulator